MVDHYCIHWKSVFQFTGITLVPLLPYQYPHPVKDTHSRSLPNSELSSSDMYNSVVSIPDYNIPVKIVFYEISILLAKSDFTKAFGNCFIVDF